MPERPWPLAPRPFPEEAMGGWLGRLAARYRMRLDEFVKRAGVDCDLAITNVGWLLAPPLTATAIDQLARQTRCDADRIPALQTP